MIDNLEDIRAASDIVSVVGQYVKLKKSGTQFSGLCPFHKEKTRSFYVHPGKQLYHCHGCGAGGDVFKFVQKIENVSFFEAKKMLAERAGITAAPMTKAERKQYAVSRELIDEAEYFAIREHLVGIGRGILIERYRQRCAADPDYRAWLLDDRKNAEEMTAALVAVLVISQERERVSA
jgi:hypothetical protein